MCNVASDVAPVIMRTALGRYSDANSYRNAGFYCDSRADAVSYCHRRTDTYCHRRTDTYCHHSTDTHCYHNTGTYCNPFTYINSYSGPHTNNYSNSNSYPSSKRLEGSKEARSIYR